ncbi:RNA polymerase sigma factor RpoE [Novipirellula galeiformis]|uniref:RNA polymerase sigma factor RpoE n=1 Tax=Novipirellula galeiformis TaxID=2528004 RepID=A0A5C6CMV7_9BACT|nr:sigma-70 family RNA polymerase sigma factor [Novipirellula galeiformis]TWU24814.1 RNA polymerase sigma factor RpoE [Novipirellula galeiformis]
MPSTIRDPHRSIPTDGGGECFDVELIERLLPQLSRIAKRSIARQWQAKVAVSDIVQDTFMEATQTLPDFSGSTIGEFNEWLRAILTNNLRDARRKYVDTQKRSIDREQPLNRLSAPTLSATDPSPSRVAESNEFDRELHCAIQGLAPTDRQILALRCQQKRTFAKIGDQLKMKEDTVRKRWGRILSALHRRLQSFDSRAFSRHP